MFVLQSAVVKGRGGIATAVAHYERMLRAVGVPSAVLFSGPSIDALRAEGADVIEAPRLLASPISAFPAVLGALGHAIAARAKAAPIVAIVHSDLTLAPLRALLPKARFVALCHSDKFKRKSRADLVITLNAAQDALARAALPHVRVAQLGNPYVAPAPAPLPAGDRPRLNFVARFIDTKQPLTLIAAAARLSPRPRLRFIGEGELEPQMRAAIAQAGLEAEFAGWLPSPFSHFHQRDILVLPSLWEGLPYLLQEALGHGVATIASDNAGNRAALGEGAYGSLFPVGDEAALAQALAEALADLDALRAKAEKGRAALSARYGADAFWRALSTELTLGEPLHV